MKRRRTDYGTIVLHWLLVSAITVAFLTGLRIASEAPDRTWINALDAILPRASVWTWHVEAAIVLVAVSIAYAIYLVRSGLSRRVQINRVRLLGLIGSKQVRLGSIGVILNWMFFGAMVTLIVSGGLLYFGVFASHDVVVAHWYAAWVVPGFALLHIVTHFRIGGASQLLRIFRPEPLPPPPPRLDAIELLALLAEKSSHQALDDAPEAALQPAKMPRDDEPSPPIARTTERRPPRRRNAPLQANPLAVAAAIAIVCASAAVAVDWIDVDSLYIRRIDGTDAPVLDGDASDPAWRNARPISLMTNQGGNFGDMGQSRVDIRAVHDGTFAYFLFTWEDPTRSLKHLPLIKEIDGWHLLHDGYERGDEQAFSEDKFSVLLTTSDANLAGDGTFHAGPQPVHDAPATMTGRGLHFTTGDYVDVWQWKATSNGLSGWMDDEHFGPPLAPSPMQIDHVMPYRGGFEPDPGTANSSVNFLRPAPDADSNAIIMPRRLPRDLTAVISHMGRQSLDPEVGESEGARWSMTEDETVPYAAEVDRSIPVGTIIPGVIISGKFSGDRADIRCAARWASGRWTLEVARRLQTGSQFDVPITSGVFMRVAAFDHSEIRHTRHVRPIRLEVE